MTSVSIARYQREFEDRRPQRAREPGWLQRLRQEGIDHLAQAGWPSKTDEDWRGTDVTPIADAPFIPASQVGLDSALRDRLPAGVRLVFVNGWFSPELSQVSGLPAGVRLGSLAAALRERPDAVEPHLGRLVGPQAGAFGAWNAALFQDGALLEVPADTSVAEPIHLVFAMQHSGGEPIVAHPRNLLVVGRGSKVSVLESYLGMGRYLANTVTEAAVGDSARLEHVRVQQEDLGAFHVARFQAKQARDSECITRSLAFGGRLSRVDLAVDLAAEGARCGLDGLYLVGAGQHVDHHTFIDHAQPRCTSRELYKGILGGKARAVFHGKVLVRQDAQKTDAAQTNQNLLLADDALLDTRPQLEIYADDVKCVHGAAVGRLDAEAVFYLRSRGLSEPEARGMLTRAFAMEVVQRVGHAGLRKQLERQLVAKLADAGLPVAEESA